MKILTDDYRIVELTMRVYDDRVKNYSEDISGDILTPTRFDEDCDAWAVDCSEAQLVRLVEAWRLGDDEWTREARQEAETDEDIDRIDTEVSNRYVNVNCSYDAPFFTADHRELRLKDWIQDPNGNVFEVKEFRPDSIIVFDVLFPDENDPSVPLLDGERLLSRQDVRESVYEFEV